MQEHPIGRFIIAPVNRRWIVPLVGLTLVAGLALGYLWGSPRLLETTPSDGAENVPAGASIRLTFSRPMQADSVRELLSFEPAREGSYTWEGNTLVFTPKQPWPNENTVRVQLAAGAPSAGIIPLRLRGEHSWSFSVGLPRLAYLYPTDAPAKLYLLDLATGEVSQLSDVPGSVLDFDLSPNGNAVYFDASLGDEGTTLYQLDIRTGEVTELYDCLQALCRYLQISPAGDLLAFEQTGLAAGDQPGYPRVWLLPIQKTDGEVKVEAGEPYLVGEPDHQTQQPLWSREGWLAYYDFSESTFVLQDIGGGERVMFESQTGVPGDWSPDGSAYVIPEISISTIGELQGLEDIPTSHLMLLKLEDSSIQDISQEVNVEDASPVYAPSGSQLAFARKYLDIARWTPGRQLWVMEVNTGEARALTEDPYYNHYDFAWSPLGDQLAYVRFNKDALIEPPEIWLVDMLNEQATRLITGGYAPQWIP